MTAEAHGVIALGVIAAPSPMHCPVQNKPVCKLPAMPPQTSAALQATTAKAVAHAVALVPCATTAAMTARTIAPHLMGARRRPIPRRTARAHVAPTLHRPRSTTTTPTRILTTTKAKPVSATKAALPALTTEAPALLAPAAQAEAAVAPRVAAQGASAAQAMAGQAVTHAAAVM